MAAALGLARRGLGQTWPNPTVGCVIAHGARVVARGRTQQGGRPHAETVALGAAGADARGATAYVSLEPCDHHGATPPCSRALIDAGVARVVAACEDSDPRVSGRGILRLRAAGVEVVVGVCEQEARALNAGFFMRVRRGRPLFTLKLATSLDARVATHSGESRWITGASARARGHALRACHDAIMIGIGTALADDPELTCRLPGREHRSPVRIVVDSKARLPLTSHLAANAGTIATWVAVGGNASGERCKALEQAGAIVLTVAEDAAGRIDATALAAALGQRGLTRVLVEGGGTLAAALIKANLIDQMAVFRAGLAIGADGKPCIGALQVDALAQGRRFVLRDVARCGGDVVEDWAALESGCSPES
jgi:diaminohydroxyphosphoribosylaminopyrimidine deaminase / 5-amino-6-(5-phosphoribosylamino)uracil reductase